MAGACCIDQKKGGGEGETTLNGFPDRFEATKWKFMTTIDNLIIVQSVKDVLLY